MNTLQKTILDFQIHWIRQHTVRIDQRSFWENTSTILILVVLTMPAGMVGPAQVGLKVNGVNISFQLLTQVILVQQSQIQ